MVVKVDVDGSPVKLPPVQVYALPVCAAPALAAPTAITPTNATISATPRTIRDLILPPSLVLSGRRSGDPGHRPLILSLRPKESTNQTSRGHSGALAQVSELDRARAGGLAGRACRQHSTVALFGSPDSEWGTNGRCELAGDTAT